ncbi:MAG: DUF349 domain-containing protein [Oleiphilaceae bacterium]|nr:DUF349 domain-containing protein [Oleiphilaceae bacterium]
MAGFLKQFFAPRKPQSPYNRQKDSADSARHRSGTASDPSPTAPPRPTDTPELLAINGATAADRLKGVEQLQEEQALQRVVKALKGRDKGAFQAARQKLKTLREAAAEEANRQKALQELIGQMETLANSEDLKLYQARLQTLEKRWQPLSEKADTEQSRRYLQALSTSRERARAMEAEKAAEETRQQQSQQQKDTLALLQESLEQLAGAVDAAGPSLSALDALLKTQHNRWQEATRDNPPDPALGKRFESLTGELERYMDAVRRLQNERESLQQALDEDAELTPLLERIDWPSRYAAPLVLREAREKAGKSAPAAAPEKDTASASDQKAAREALEQAIRELEQSLGDKQLNPAKQQFRRLQKLRDQSPKAVVNGYRDRITALGRQLGELRDWQGFATRPKQEALCEQMAYLASQQHMDPETKARHIQELQQAWRDLGGSPDQALWQQFKQAADEAFAPCKDYFAARDELKHANLSQREAICEQLQTFVDNADWQQCDWKGVEKIHRQARMEWREAKPVDLRANRPLQKRFDQLLKQIDQQLDSERERNIAAKESIVSRAEALIDHEPLAEATESAKALQKEWQSLGITPRGRDRELWQAFRAACDRIFARLSARNEALDAARDQARQEGEALLAQLQALSPSQADPATLRQIRQSFEALDLPADSRELKSRFQHQLGQLQDQQIHALQQRRGEDWKQALHQHRSNQPVPVESFTQAPLPAQQITDQSERNEQARAYCVRLEILTGADSPGEDRSLRMAMQVSRLNDSLQGQQSPESLWDEIDALLAGFCQLESEPALPEGIYQRLERVIDHWLSTPA